jgi:Zn-dependent protease
LPPDAKQAHWIKDKSQQLELAANLGGIPRREEGAPTDHSWALKFGPLAPIAILVWKAKALFVAIFKFKFIFSFFAFLALYWQLYGIRFGLGFAALVLIHEMGHYIDIRRRGLPAEMPVFLPGLGAFVQWRAIGVSLETRAFVSLAGPLAGLISAAACEAWWMHSHDGLYAALALWGAGLTVLNLMPIWILDGGQAARALSRQARWLLLVVSIALCFIHGGLIFSFVAAGSVYLVFFNKEPAPDGNTPVGWGGEHERPSLAAAVYFIAMLVALALILHALPSTAPGV